MQCIRKLFSLTIVILFVSGMALADWKIKQKVTMQGRGSETTIYVKGARKRTEGGFMGIGADVATIEQCDMRRYVKVNDGKKQYFITPFDEPDEPAPAKKTPKGNSFVEAAAEGTVTYIYSVIDTGERQQMFGLTARHIKTTMTIQSSPDACSKQDMEMKMDGWYVDLPEFSCPVTERHSAPDFNPRADGKVCRDKVITKTSGGGKLGFPLTETRTFGTGASAFTQTTETLEFSKAPLDAALFDIPQGYALAKKEQDLYGQPSMADMAAIASSVGVETGQATSSTAKKEGFKRVGVLMPENKSGTELAMSNIQSFLTNVIRGEKIEAVPIATAADAASAQCDFVFSSEVTKLKQSSLGMIGGILGKATGVPTGSQKYETQIGYVLSKPDGTQVLNKQSSLKTNGTPESVVQAAYSQAMGDVMRAVNK